MTQPRHDHRQATKVAPLDWALKSNEKNGGGEKCNTAMIRAVEIEQRILKLLKERGGEGQGGEKKHD